MNKCQVSGCTGIYHCKGYCKPHYKSWYRYGNAVVAPKRSPRLGQASHPLYFSYAMMKQRCNNPNHKNYSRYGGRGIMVCERWRGDNGFLNFIADVGSRPAGKTLDRVDNDGNYEPSNVRWATQKEQCNNKTQRVAYV